MWQLDAVQALRRDWMAANTSDRTTCYPIYADRLEGLGVENVDLILSADVPPPKMTTSTRDTADRPASPPNREQRRLVCTLAEILTDPAALAPPVAVVPRLAWAGRVTLLAAREKGGKSTLATAAAAMVSKDRGSWLDDTTVHGDVLWVGLEEHTSDLAARMVGYGATPNRIFIISSLATESDPLGQIHAEARSLRPALIVVDTLAALVEATGARPESGAASAWTPFMTSLTRIARDTDAAVVLLHHARKSDGKYRDSSAIGANVDVIIEMQEEKEPDVRTLHVKARWKVGDYTVKLVGERYDLVSGESSVEERILRFITSHRGCAMRALRENVGARADDVKTTVHALIERGVVVNKGNAAAMSLYVASAEGAPDHNAEGASPPQHELPIGVVPSGESLPAGSGTTPRMGSDADSDREVEFVIGVSQRNEVAP